MYFSAETEEDDTLSISSIHPSSANEWDVANLAYAYPHIIYFEADLVPPMNDLLETVIKMSAFGANDIKEVARVLTNGILFDDEKKE